MPLRRKTSRQLGYLLLLLILFCGMAVPPAEASSVASRQPGATTTFRQTIPLNIVLLGYPPGMVDAHVLRQALPTSYRPVVRTPRLLYGLEGRDLGLEFTFRSDVIQADSRFADDFFAYLSQIGQPGDITEFQRRYNEQERNVLDVTGPVLSLDGPAVERWLMEQGRDRLGIDPARSYTLYFVNWYGRPDFRFHVYQTTDTLEPDTGANFGLRDQNRSIAWGGSHGRTWFYDLSAGPEFATQNYIVDTQDLDGNGKEDYRMPPIWEYAPGGYRDPAALSSDLGKIARFVGINLLFTSSPLYDPLLTAPAPGGAKYPFVVTLRDNPASPGPLVQTDFVLQELRRFQPYYSWKIGAREVSPIDAGAERAFRIAVGLLEEDDCWNDFGDSFAQLFCSFSANRDAYLPPANQDYVIGTFVFDTRLENMGFLAGALGTADDNWRDGAQSFVYTWTYEPFRGRGRGPSWTTLHEIGHHLGMSHPFDGYDAELDVDYLPEDDYLYVGIGLQSDSVMSVLRTSNRFGQFDRDNMYRYEFAGYLNAANALLGAIIASPRAPEVRAQVAQAQQTATRAIRGFHGWDYLTAASAAWQTYETVRRAADQIGVQVPPDLSPATLSAPQTGLPTRAPWLIDWER